MNNIESMDDNEIRLLSWRDAIRTRPGMYIGGVTNADQLLKEEIDNHTDESMNCSWCDTIIIEQDFNGYILSCDDGRGFPIYLSRDKEGQTQLEVAVSSLHAGSKFSAKEVSQIGQNGCGTAIVNALSESYIVLSRVNEDNYDKSIKIVREAWEKLGPRQRKDLYYIIAFERGFKVYESAERISDIEKKLFGTFPTYQEFPRDMSTLSLFKPDPEIFESISAKLPRKNLEYFTLVQEKFYKRKINIWINGEKLRDNIEPYQFEFTKTIIPADTSKNPQIQVYCGFTLTEDLSTKNIEGGINTIPADGVHLNYMQQAFEAALKSEYKISRNNYLTEGLNLFCLVQAGDIIFDSQSKVRLKNITKVKASDFQEIAKEFIKIFRKNSDIFEQHVTRLQALADSMRSFSAKEKSLRMISSGRGVGFYKSRALADLPKGFSDATSSDRMQCELFLCLPAEQEVLLVNPEGSCEYKLAIGDIVEMFKDKENIPELYTYATTSTGKSKKTKIIAAKETRTTWNIVRVVLSDGSYLRCTPNHKIRLVDGEYKEASKLEPKDKIMIREGEGKSDITVAIIQWENHKEPIPVYCLEVQDREHNFALENGVVVKNSEGLSAGSALINGRHSPLYHAVLSLRGKVLNISDKDESQALDNKEIGAIFKLLNLGTSAASVFDECKTPEEVQAALIKNGAYGKIVISTDADDDGLQIRNALVYTFARMGKFVIDLGMLYYVESPIFIQNGRFFYPSDPFGVDGFPIGLDPSRKFRRIKGLGSLNRDEIYDAFFNPQTRRLIQVTTEGIDYGMKLVEDINERKKLLIDEGIITNPFGFKD